MPTDTPEPHPRSRCARTSALGIIALLTMTVAFLGACGPTSGTDGTPAGDAGPVDAASFDADADVATDADADAADGDASAPDPCAAYLPGLPLTMTPCAPDGGTPGTCSTVVEPACTDPTQPLCVVQSDQTCADGTSGAQWFWFCACGGDYASCTLGGEKLSGGCAP